MVWYHPKPCVFFTKGRTGETSCTVYPSGKDAYEGFFIFPWRYTAFRREQNVNNTSKINWKENNIPSISVDNTTLYGCNMVLSLVLPPLTIYFPFVAVAVSIIVSSSPSTGVYIPTPMSPVIPLIFLTKAATTTTTSMPCIESSNKVKELD